jgi:hypothetical protein
MVVASRGIANGVNQRELEAVCVEGHPALEQAVDALRRLRKAGACEHKQTERSGPQHFSLSFHTLLLCCVEQ